MGPSVPTYKQKCDTKRRQKCEDNYRTVYDTRYEEVCEDKPTEVCEKHWEEDGKGGKIWVDDPATCKTIYKTECRDEERKVPRREKYQTCDWETYQDCYQGGDSIEKNIGLSFGLKNGLRFNFHSETSKLPIF